MKTRGRTGPGPRKAGGRSRNRRDIVAAALAAAGPGASFDPIRAQKLMFLIDREVSDRIGGPFFHFKPYHYGPFDRAIYDVIGRLVEAGTVRVDNSGPYNRYQLTESGHRRGEATLASLPASVADYMRRAARWICLMPYRRMLAAIYREYPEMAVNSVVRHFGAGRHARRESPFIRGMTGAFDLTGTMYRTPDSEVGLQSDTDAIHETWRTVGDDIEEAMVQFGEAECVW